MISISKGSYYIINMSGSKRRHTNEEIAAAIPPIVAPSRLDSNKIPTLREIVAETGISIAQLSRKQIK